MSRSSATTLARRSRRSGAWRRRQTCWWSSLCLPARTFAWLSGEAPGDLNEAATASLDGLRGATAGAAQTVEVKLAPELTVDDLAEIAAASEIDLLAAGRLPLKSISAVGELRKRQSLAVLWTAGAPAGDRPITNILCVALGERARTAVAEFLRDHGTPALHASVLLTEARIPGDLAGTLNVAGIEATVDLLTPWEASRRRWRGEGAPDAAPDLLVLARFPGASLRSAPWPAPVLILPPPRAAGPALRRAIDLPDLVDEGGVIRARFDYALGVGRREPDPQSADCIRLRRPDRRRGRDERRRRRAVSEPRGRARSACFVWKASAASDPLTADRGAGRR